MKDFIIFGEILFDVFGDARTLGGAPLNVAAHLSRLGLAGSVVSAVGDDALGRAALNKIRDIGLDDRAIAVLKGRETGRADVVMSGGNADYTFNEPAAWDFIPCPAALESETQILYFGTLALRSENNRATLAALLRGVKARHVFYDVNIRKHFYSADIIKHALKACTILKMNDRELPLVEDLTGCRGIENIMERYSIDIALLTSGRNGADAVRRGGARFHTDASDVPVADTVGAGDALSAGFLASYVKGIPIDTALRTGVILADYVVSHRGAIPDYDARLTASLKRRLPNL